MRSGCARRCCCPSRTAGLRPPQQDRPPPAREVLDPWCRSDGAGRSAAHRAAARARAPAGAAAACPGTSWRGLSRPRGVLVPGELGKEPCPGHPPVPLHGIHRNAEDACRDACPGDPRCPHRPSLGEAHHFATQEIGQDRPEPLPLAALDFVGAQMPRPARVPGLNPTDGHRRRRAERRSGIGPFRANRVRGPGRSRRIRCVLPDCRRVP